MDDYRNNYSRRKRSRDSFERKMDNWIQTGRQVVDGVSGTRPGQRRGDKQDLLTRSNFDNVGRWVGEKIDWFFEDDDEWIENTSWEEDLDEDLPLAKRKRPLRAISLRGPKALSPDMSNQGINSKDNSWPDQSSFQVERWERKDDFYENETKDLKQSKSDLKYKKRQLPRSSRRKRT